MTLVSGLILFLKLFSENWVHEVSVNLSLEIKETKWVFFKADWKKSGNYENDVHREDE